MPSLLVKAVMPKHMAATGATPSPTPPHLVKIQLPLAVMATKPTLLADVAATVSWMVLAATLSLKAAGAVMLMPPVVTAPAAATRVAMPLLPVVKVVLLTPLKAKAALMVQPMLGVATLVKPLPQAVKAAIVINAPAVTAALAVMPRQLAMMVVMPPVPAQMRAAMAVTLMPSVVKVAKEPLVTAINLCRKQAGMAAMVVRLQPTLAALVIPLAQMARLVVKVVTVAMVVMVCLLALVVVVALAQGHLTISPTVYPVSLVKNVKLSMLSGTSTIPASPMALLFQVRRYL
jgi:hypothetical protein